MIVSIWPCIRLTWLTLRTFSPTFGSWIWIGTLSRLVGDEIHDTSCCLAPETSDTLRLRTLSAFKFCYIKSNLSGLVISEQETYCELILKYCSHSCTTLKSNLYIFESSTGSKPILIQCHILFVSTYPSFWEFAHRILWVSICQLHPTCLDFGHLRYLLASYRCFCRGIGHCFVVWTFLIFQNTIQLFCLLSGTLQCSLSLARYKFSLPSLE